MHYTFLDFLCSAFVPVVFTQVTTSAANNIHTGFIAVATVWTIPFKVVVAKDFAFVTTFHTVVKFCVHLCILHIFVHVFDECKDNFRVLCKVWKFNVTDCTTAGNRMELAFESEFFKSVNFFTYKNVVAVCKTVAVCNAFDNTKTALEAFCKTFVICALTIFLTCSNIPSWFLQ